MAKIKKHDFVEIEYTGKTADDNTIFDTTDIEVAKKNELFDESATYGPIVVCVGEHQVIKGIDNYLTQAEAPSETSVTVTPEEGFGRKDTKLIKMIPTKKFTEQKMTPMPGLQVNIDGLIGIIKKVGGGRTLVDFNHPLASRELLYRLKINGIITDDAEKLESYLKMHFGSGIKIDGKEGYFTAVVPDDVPKELQKSITDKAKQIIPSVKDISFIKKNK